MRFVGGIQVTGGAVHLAIVGTNAMVRGAISGLTRDMTVEVEGTHDLLGGFTITSWKEVSPDTPATDIAGNVYDGVRPGYTLIPAGRLRQTTTLNGFAEILKEWETNPPQPDPLSDPVVKEAYWRERQAVAKDALAKTATWADPAATPMGATNGQAVGSDAAFRVSGDVINLPFVGAVPAPSPVVLLVVGVVAAILIIKR